MKRHLQLCGRMGRALGELRGEPFDRPAAQGVVIFSMLERAWSYCQLYSDTLPETEVQHEIATDLERLLNVAGRRRPRT
jgi:hypothetical protein